MSIDRLSNMLSSLKNAAMAGKDFVEVPYTTTCANVANVLKEAGFLSEVRTFKPEASSYKMLSLSLAQDEDGTKLTNVRRISKPGHRVYSASSELKTLRGYGVRVVSTSRGIVSAAEARKRNLGGEVLCEVF